MKEHDIAHFEKGIRLGFTTVSIECPHKCTYKLVLAHLSHCVRRHFVYVSCPRPVIGIASDRLWPFNIGSPRVGQAQQDPCYD
jgi:hypothetical protein